jgi:hypothetical protein
VFNEEGSFLSSWGAEEEGGGLLCVGEEGA